MKKPLILIIIFSLVTISSPLAFGAIKAGSKCKEKDYNRGTKIKVGEKIYTCIGADSGYFWYPATSKNNSSGYDQMLGLPAQNYVYSGQSLQAVQLSMGISFNNGTRPITLKELGDKIYTATSRMSGSWLSKNDVQIGLQPGNGLYNLLAGLMTNQTAFDAIAYEITLQGAKH